MVEFYRGQPVTRRSLNLPSLAVQIVDRGTERATTAMHLLLDHSAYHDDDTADSFEQTHRALSVHQTLLDETLVSVLIEGAEVGNTSGFDIFAELSAAGWLISPARIAQGVLKFGAVIEERITRCRHRRPVGWLGL